MAKAPMSALTIRQPYAWLIVSGYKDIENRSWKPAAARIGQRFWIHASQRRLTKANFEDFLADMRDSASRAIRSRLTTSCMAPSWAAR
jgi:hypothetical protein